MASSGTYTMRITPGVTYRKPMRWTSRRWATLPAVATTLGFGNRVTALAAAARKIFWGRIAVLHD